MPTFQFNKLVRDGLPKMYDELKQVIVQRKLSGKEMLIALRAKLVEESAEIPFEGGDRQKIIEELSDVEQVIADIREQLSLSIEQIEDARKKKLSKKGGFAQGVFVETIRLEDGDEWVKYYRREPAKYPEIKSDDGTDPVLPTVEKGTYRHNKKGQLYEVLGVALQTETNEPLVIYRPLYESEYELFARPLSMFSETVEIDGVKKPRFEKVG